MGRPDPLIPSVFVTMGSGLVLKRMLVVYDVILLVIIPATGIEWVSMVMSALLALLAFLLIMLTMYALTAPPIAAMRNWGVLINRTAPAGDSPNSHQGPQGLPEAALLALPWLIFEKPVPRSTVARGSLEEGGVHKGEAVRETGNLSSSSSDCGCVPPARGVHAGETKRTCAICLESYEAGQKLRILPCYHRFHMDCVDHWLGSHRLCPVCKWDAAEPKVAHWPAGAVPQQQEESSAVGGLFSRVMHALHRRIGLASGSPNPELEPLLPHLPSNSFLGDVEQGGGSPGQGLPLTTAQPAPSSWTPPASSNEQTPGPAYTDMSGGALPTSTTLRPPSQPDPGSPSTASTAVNLDATGRPAFSVPSPPITINRPQEGNSNSQGPAGASTEAVAASVDLAPATPAATAPTGRMRSSRA
eukprot:gene12401-15592_t